MSAANASQGSSGAGLPFPIQDGEVVIQVCRRHWIYLWPHVALQVTLGLAPLIAVLVLISAADLSGIVAGVLWLLAGLHAVYRAWLAFLAWYRYHNDIWVITNQRLIDSYKRHPFSLRVVTADLVNVQDLSVDRHGILSTMLNFGDIICQTASEAPDIRLSGIPNPMEIQALVDRERDRERLG